MSSFSRPNATTMTVEEIVTAAWNGRIRIPKFQRQLRWTTEDVIKLMDSIVKGYPIGNLLLWERRGDKQQVILGDLILEAPEMERAYWVVDGQQRITSLANALSKNIGPSSRFAISYDLKAKEFLKTPPYPPSHLIPLNILFDLRAVLSWFSNNPDMIVYIEEANTTTQQLRQFDIPAYVVESDDPKILRDIFDRMNNYGRQLTRAEVFSALHASEEASGNRPSFTQIAEDIDSSLNFGTIEDNVILSSILATRGPEVRREIRTEFKGETPEQVDEAYRKGQTALHKTVLFLQEDAGVPHVAFLPYSYPLVVLARFFGLFPDPQHRTLELLARWYWRTVAAGPEHFKGGTPNAARVLCGKINRNDDIDAGESHSIQSLLRSVPRSLRNIELLRFAPQEAATKLLLCAMWDAQPLNPLTSEGFSSADIAESIGKHSTASPILAKVELPKVGQTLGARFILPGGDEQMRALLNVLSRESSPQAGEICFTEEERQEILSSHFLPTAHSANIDLVGLVKERSTELSDALTNYLLRECRDGMEDTPAMSSMILGEGHDDGGGEG